MSKIAVVGAGYVGLVTGACFASKGNTVFVVEKDTEKIAALLDGKVPFYEPGLDGLVRQAIEKKTLIFMHEIAEALLEKPVAIFSCVGTPSLPDGSADMSYVTQVAAEIGRNLHAPTVIVNKSTVPVGTAQNVDEIIDIHLKKRGIALEFDVASNPEFLKEGSAIRDFLYPDRVVIGVTSKWAESVLRDLYAPFLSNVEQLLVMNRESAELTKYGANAMLATRISFMNQLALLADKVGADIDEVKRGMGSDKRIGKSFLQAGIGYGGSCFPKDVKALIDMGKRYNEPMSLVAEVDGINDAQRDWFVNKIDAYYNHKLKGKRIGIWGLSFKPETDDIRCAPSLDVIAQLNRLGAEQVVYDPVAMHHVRKIFNTKISYATTPREVLERVDALVILTEWKEFLSFSPQDFTALENKVVFDGRNCFSPAKMAMHGITYVNVGKNNVASSLNADPAVNISTSLFSHTVSRKELV